MVINDVRQAVSMALYQQRHENIFKSRESLRWFIRRHRARLMERGALTAPIGELLIVEDLFNQVVQEVGAERAASLSESAAG